MHHGREGQGSQDNAHGGQRRDVEGPDVHDKNAQPGEDDDGAEAVARSPPPGHHADDHIDQPGSRVEVGYPQGTVSGLP